MLRKAFTLIEALIAVAVLSLIVFSIVALVTNMGSIVRKDFKTYCLVQAAISGIEAVRANGSIRSISLICEGETIRVSLRNGSRISDSCYEVISRAESGTRSISLKGVVCDFGG